MPDSLIFNSISNILFDDWKVRIIDKFIHNKYYYLFDVFKIAYVIIRFGGKAMDFTLLRRWENVRNLYLSIIDLLNHLSDVYEKLWFMKEEENNNIYYTLK